jgi:hypothetical protein
MNKTKASPKKINTLLAHTSKLGAISRSSWIFRGFHRAHEQASILAAAFDPDLNDYQDGDKLSLKIVMVMTAVVSRMTLAKGRTNNGTTSWLQEVEYKGLQHQSFIPLIGQRSDLGVGLKKA